MCVTYIFFPDRWRVCFAEFNYRLWKFDLRLHCVWFITYARNLYCQPALLLCIVACLGLEPIEEMIVNYWHMPNVLGIVMEWLMRVVKSGWFLRSFPVVRNFLSRYKIVKSYFFDRKSLPRRRPLGPLPFVRPSPSIRPVAAKTQQIWAASKSILAQYPKYNLVTSSRDLDWYFEFLIKKNSFVPNSGLSCTPAPLLALEMYISWPKCQNMPFS